MIQIFGTPKCKGTREAQRFFAERGIKVQVVDVREKGLSKGELASVARAVGGMSPLFDSDGTRARDRGLRHLGADEARLAELLVADPLLLRTPIVRAAPHAAVGAAKDAWKSFAERAK